MRCYFLRGGHICAVELLTDGKEDAKAISDAEAIRRSAELFRQRKARKQSVDGFEVWDRSRFIHRFPTDDDGPNDSDTPTSVA